tara:strand:+ start:210 stop:488 length:279 start_codon:yes stop_codon:yes gene_type:complete
MFAGFYNHKTERRKKINMVMKKQIKKTNLSKLRQIIRERQFQKIKGTLVDGSSAKAILNVHDALKPTQKKIYRKMLERDIAKAGRIAWKLHR